MPRMHCLEDSFVNHLSVKLISSIKIIIIIIIIIIKRNNDEVITCQECTVNKSFSRNVTMTR